MAAAKFYVSSCTATLFFGQIREFINPTKHPMRTEMTFCWWDCHGKWNTVKYLIFICRRCSNYIFILNLTPGFSGLSEDNCARIQETFKLLRFGATYTWVFTVLLLNFSPCTIYEMTNFGARLFQVSVFDCKYHRVSILYMNTDMATLHWNIKMEIDMVDKTKTCFQKSSNAIASSLSVTWYTKYSFSMTIFHEPYSFIAPPCGAFDLGLAVSVPLPIVMGIFVLLWFQSRLT